MSTGELKISGHGRTTLPAAICQRWGLATGGAVGYIDLGDAIILAPVSLGGWRSDALNLLNGTDWASARAGFGDPDLATE